MTDARTVIAAALPALYLDRAAVADNILHALTQAGYAVVKLPPMTLDELGAPTWPVVQHWNGKETSPGEVRIRSTDGHISATSVSNPHDCPADARALAAALLAAAHKAEAGT